MKTSALSFAQWLDKFEVEHPEKKFASAEEAYNFYVTNAQVPVSLVMGADDEILNIVRGAIEKGSILLFATVQDGNSEYTRMGFKGDFQALANAITWQALNTGTFGQVNQVLSTARDLMQHSAELINDGLAKRSGSN